MNTTITLPLLLAAAALAAGPQQRSLSQVDSSLVPQGGAPQAIDAGAWVQGLRSDDLDTRMQTYQRVLDSARGDRAARAVVEGWAADAQRCELAWTAQLLLRELDAAPSRRAPWGSGTSPFGSDAFDFGPFGSDLLDSGGFDTRFHDLFRDLDLLLDQHGGSGAWRWPQSGLRLPPGGSTHSQGFSLKTGPDGVRVEIREDQDGEEQVQTYEAESLEALLEAHPELGERIHSAPGRGFLFGTPRQALPWDLLLGRRDGEPRLDRLGVQVLDSEAFTREVQGLSEGVGLEVVSVLPGSLGEALDLRVGDVVTHVNGHTIHGVEDVQRALAEREQDEDVVVEAIAPDGSTRTRSWSPTPPPEAVPKPLQPLGD